MTTITARSQEPPKEFHAPDGKSLVRMLDKPMPGADLTFDFFTLEVRSGNKIVAREPTCGYLMSAHWSPDGKWLAVNNRRGNSGDYVWIFSLPDGRCIKRPDDKTGVAWEKVATRAIHAKISGEPMKGWVTTSGFNPKGTLSLTVREMIQGEGPWDFDATVSLPSLKLGPGKATPAE